MILIPLLLVSVPSEFQNLQGVERVHLTDAGNKKGFEEGGHKPPQRV